MKLKTIAAGPVAANTYIAYGEKDDECFVVDVGSAEPVLEFIRAQRLKCTHILLTHGHFDHVLGVADLKDATGAQVCIHVSDAAALWDESVSLSRFVAARQRMLKPDIELRHGDEVFAAGMHVRVFETPGHTSGGVCYVLERERVIFSGDSLFRLSVGRTDLPGGSSHTLRASISELFKLEGDYDVYPGHEGKTTLDLERSTNPFMNRWSADEW